MKETKSNWDNVASFMKGKLKAISLGKHASDWFYKTPRRMLNSLSYYKFAAKMIGKERRVLDIGSNEGLGTFLLAKECGYAKGIDLDEESIVRAQSNFAGETLTFAKGDFLTISKDLGKWDAVTSFDVIGENRALFFKAITDSLTPHGLAIIGTPSPSDSERFEKEMRNFFEYVFLFGASDEIVHTGYSSSTPYLIAIGAKKRA